MIIALNGYSGVGKDTIGIIIQYLNCKNIRNISIETACNDYNSHQEWLEEQSQWEIKKFAGKLKDIASHLTGIDIEDFEDQEFKKTNLGPEWALNSLPISVREFLQKLGTDALRNGLHDNVWVNALMADYQPLTSVSFGIMDLSTPMLQMEKMTKPIPIEYPNWIITDVRFPNEAQAIKDKGGIIIRVDRPGVKPINDHPSEIGLDDWAFDYKIANVSDIFSLKFTVQNILKHAKLLP